MKPDLIKVEMPDGAVNAFSVFPSAQYSNAVVVIFPAMGVKGHYYRHYAETLAKEGIHVATIDHRGHGQSSVRPSRRVNFGYKEQVEIEYPLLVKAIKQHLNVNTVIVMGHSLGGQMGSMFVSRYPQLVNGFILNASCSVYYKGWGKAGIGVWLFAQASNLLAKIKGNYPGSRIGFGGLEARGVISDWAHTSRTNSLAAHGSDYDYDKAIAESTLPILALSYQGDSSAPPLALNYLLEKFTKAPIETHHVRSSQKKYNHYSWVREPQTNIPVVKEWAKRIS
jgi:predicted alpha/beta hydrolase